MKRTNRTLAPDLTRANKRASILIEAMLGQMHYGLRNPKMLTSDEWVRLFGNKQSMMANLQKLVQALAALKEPRGKKTSAATDYPEGEAMNPQDMQILSAWMTDEHA